MSRSGQSTVEYMLVIAVLVIAMVTVVDFLALGIMVPMAELGDKAQTVYTDGSIAD